MYVKDIKKDQYGITKGLTLGQLFIVKGLGGKTVYIQLTPMTEFGTTPEFASACILEEATSFQIAWLEECIRQNRFIPCYSLPFTLENFEEAYEIY